MKELIESCIETQLQLNSLIDPEWQAKRLPWVLYMAIEMGELCDHLMPYHWKSGEPNHEQAFIELIDCFHFLVSDYFMKANDTTIELTTARLVNHLLNRTKVDYQLLDPEVLFVSKAPNMYCFDDMFRVAKFFHKSHKEFFQMYLAKDALNLFRQHNGYKKGTYIKKWAEGEDNVYLSKILSNFDWDLPNPKRRLLDELNTQYQLHSGVSH